MSSSSSRQASTTSTSADTTSNVTNENISGLESSTVFSDTGDIALSDYGSIDRSFDFAGNGLSQLLDFGSNVVNNQQMQLSDTLKSINAASGASADLSSANDSATMKVAIKYLSVAAVVVGIVLIIKKVK